MAKSQEQQIAVCIEVEVVKVKGNPKEVYTFVLENKEFKVWESKYFKAVINGQYRPIIDVIPTIRHGKNGDSAVMAPVVNWAQI